MEWHTVSKLSLHQDTTAEGYLICRDVPIARTGTQIYWENEVPPLQGDVGGRVHVDREASEVFCPDSVRSFEGKPLVDNHPFDAVGPDNWSDLAIGYVANVRRGAGVHDDLLLGDLVFTTRRGIDAVRRGKRAISVGYNAFYEQTAPGLGRQKNIFCNHVALVDEGRCGARCTIMDGHAVYNYDGPNTPAAPWRESEHPRVEGGAEAGEFTAGGGGEGGSGEGDGDAELAKSIGVEYADPVRKRPIFNITRNGQTIGRANLAGGAEGRFVDLIELDKEHQNQGIAKHVYNQIEKTLGHKLVPSPLGLSEQATRMWQKRLAAMPPEQAAGLIEQAKGIGREFGLKEQHLAERLDPLMAHDTAWFADIDFPANENIDWGDAGWVEAEHPRGQPENAGEFAEGAGGGAGKSDKEKRGPASELLPDVPDMTTQQQIELGNQIADELGIGDEVAKVRDKLSAADKGSSTGKFSTMSNVSDGGHIDDKTGQFTPERQALHKQIIDELFNDEDVLKATPEPGQKPVMTMLGGRGGSGKSWITKTGPAKDMKSITVDADHFKQQLPEYAGWNAWHVHDESDHLVSKAQDRAQELGINVTHDATLKSSKGAAERLASYKGKGFDTHGYYMHLPPETATRRAMERFQRGGGIEGKGRFVAPEVVLGNTQNERNFDAMIPDFQKWGVYDNRGAAPRFVAGNTGEKNGGAKAPGKDRGRGQRRGQRQWRVLFARRA